MFENERSTDDIRKDITREKEDLSRTAHQISDRIKEKLDLIAYVKDSPYWALGAAVVLGFLVSKMVPTRTTPMKRIMNSLAGEVNDLLGGLHVVAAQPGRVQVTATKVATGLIKNIWSAGTSGGIRPQPQTDRKQITAA